MWPLGCDPGMGEEQNSGSSQEKKIQKTSASDWKKIQQQSLLLAQFSQTSYGAAV